MKNSRLFLCLAAVLALALPFVASEAAADPTALFPELDGWTRDGVVASSSRTTSTSTSTAPPKISWPTAFSGWQCRITPTGKSAP